jgi:hypothetical protein
VYGSDVSLATEGGKHICGLLLCGKAFSSLAWYTIASLGVGWGSISSRTTLVATLSSQLLEWLLPMRIVLV